MFVIGARRCVPSIDLRQGQRGYFVQSMVRIAEPVQFGAKGLLDVRSNGIVMVAMNWPRSQPLQENQSRWLMINYAPSIREG